MISFYIPHRKKNEKIILLIRRHWFVLFKRMAFWFLAALIPLILYVLVGANLSSYIGDGFLYTMLVILASVFYLYVWLFIFNGFIDYYLDVWIVTNIRIIDIEQRQLFSRVVSEHKLEKIQDVTSEIHGILPTFLNYGQVFIQTAGEQQRFVFQQVSKPRTVKRKITSLCEQRRHYLKIRDKAETPVIESS